MMSTALVQQIENSEMLAPMASPALSAQEMQARLAEMKTKLTLLKQFFREVLEPDIDYGKLPGTSKPCLYKAGAEKLAELYGFSSEIKQIEEERDLATGYYRARVVVQLRNRRTGELVAEGIGECNTMEESKRYRWLTEDKLPPGLDKNALESERRFNRETKSYYTVYRLENKEPWSQWNAVLKQAKKRAYVDAVLSATRSSGIFTQDLEDMEDYLQIDQMGIETKRIRAKRRAERRKENKETEPSQSESKTEAKPMLPNQVTPNQRDYILRLARQLAGADVDLEAWLKKEYNLDIDAATSAQASELIKTLRDRIQERQAKESA